MAQAVRTYALLIFVVASAAMGQTAPSPAEFLGREIGERFTPHHRIVAYFEALAAARPGMVTLTRFGETWEGRPLLYATITSPANHARLDTIRSSNRALSDPRTTTRAEAQRIASSNPAVVWLAFGVHGDESSSAEAAMLVAHRLMSEEPAVRSILDDVVVIIDPLQNPDGRERYINWFETRVGRVADPDPEAMEHHQPWPGGRYNHYLVDMNRDWVWSTQPESKARVAAYLQWKPQVFVDFHEMGYSTSYFFPPDADPINLNIDPETESWLRAFGTANADAFSSRGWPFFVGERFDLFYPGYGDSWPSLQGSIGMTYEMAGHGLAGRAIEREDGTILTLADRAEKHFTTAMATLATAASRSEDLVLHTYDVVSRQISRPETTYLIPPDAPNAHAAVSLLTRQGVEVHVLNASRTVTASPVLGGNPVLRSLPAGTIAVSTRQPQGAIVTTLFEKSPALEPAFIEAQRQLIEADEPDEFYDITAWSLPIAMNLTVLEMRGAIPTSALAPYAPPPAPPLPAEGRYGWIVDGRDPGRYRFAGELLRREIGFSVVEAELIHEGKTFARGAMLVQRYNNDGDVLQQVQAAASEAGVTVEPIESGWSGGLSLGSHRVHFVRDPKIAIVGGAGTAPTSYGALWHTLDQDARIPHTSLSLDRLRNADLSKYRVIILPDGTGYASVLGKSGLERLKNWVEQGNTLIAIARSARALRGEETPISRTRLWAPPEEKDDDEDVEVDKRHHDYSVPGAAFRTDMNARSFLTLGMESSPPVLVEGSDVLLPVPYGVDNVIRIPKENALLAGFAWPESVERLSGSSWLVVEKAGEGRVITFAGEPYFRSFWSGTLPLLLNGALYSPSF